MAQIAMLKHDLVEVGKWVSPPRFMRAYAAYQVLPGPEATELCCYFGYIAKGRGGAFLAGLGFLLPGFFLMLLASYLYTLFGTGTAHQPSQGLQALHICSPMHQMWSNPESVGLCRQWHVPGVVPDAAADHLGADLPCRAQDRRDGAL